MDCAGFVASPCGWAIGARRPSTGLCGRAVRGGAVCRRGVVRMESDAGLGGPASPDSADATGNDAAAANLTPTSDGDAAETGAGVESAGVVPGGAGEEEEANVLQGPSPAPTGLGSSTVGLGEEEEAFISVCYKADVTAIEVALDRGVDVNIVDVNRRSALHLCAGHGLAPLCARLIEGGANINLQDVMGFTPLHMAAGYRKMSTVGMLVDAGADPNISSLVGQLPVEVAEEVLARTPKKKFFMNNPEYGVVNQIVELLDKVTELEEDDEEDDEDDSESETLSEESTETETTLTEVTPDATFVVRVKPRSGDSVSTPPPPPPSSDVKVTVRVRTPENNK